jgi:hypothetical protein
VERFLSDERTLSWLTLGLATIGSITALVEIDGDDRFLLLAALLPFILRVVLPGFPAWAALVVTTVVVVIANIDGTAEGAFFLPIVAVLPVVATDPHRVRAGGGSVLGAGRGLVSHRRRGAGLDVALLVDGSAALDRVRRGGLASTGPHR